jgi:hypothetical protein
LYHCFYFIEDVNGDERNKKGPGTKEITNLDAIHQHHPDVGRAGSLPGDHNGLSGHSSSSHHDGKHKHKKHRKDKHKKHHKDGKKHHKDGKKHHKHGKKHHQDGKNHHP